MEITTILWWEWLFLKRRLWRVTFSQMVSSFLYLVTFGTGLGRVMEMDGKPYLYYLIPGPLAMTTMRSSYISVSIRISVMCPHEKSFECYPYSLTWMYLLATEHILAGALRDMYSGIFIVLLGIVSGVRLAMNGWLPTAVILDSLIFSVLGFLAAMMMESHYGMNNFTSIVITSMSLLCDIFLSLDGIPEVLKWVVNTMPLTYMTRLIRETSLGSSVSRLSMATAVLLATAFTGGCVWACYREAKVQKQELWKELQH